MLKKKAYYIGAWRVRQACLLICITSRHNVVCYVGYFIRWVIKFTRIYSQKKKKKKKLQIHSALLHSLFFEARNYCFFKVNVSINKHQNFQGSVTRFGGSKKINKIQSLFYQPHLQQSSQKALYKNVTKSPSIKSEDRPISLFFPDIEHIYNLCLQKTPLTRNISS